MGDKDDQNFNFDGELDDAAWDDAGQEEFKDDEAEETNAFDMGVDSGVEDPLSDSDSLADDMFDPSHLAEDGSHDEVDSGMMGQAAPEKEGLAGIIERLKSGWPFYAGIAAAVVFGLYLISSILGGSDPQPAQTQANAVESSRGLGLTASQTENYAGSLPHPSEVAGHSEPRITLEQKDVASLIKGFTEVVNTNVQKLSEGVSSELVNVERSLKEQSEKGSTVEVQRMRTSLETLVDRLIKYEDRLARVDNTLDELTNLLRLLVSQKTAENNQLSLRAVIPGRAWLVNERGQTVTVTEGMSLQPFGKVVKIDADSGSVVMSSGYVFN